MDPTITVLDVALQAASKLQGDKRKETEVLIRKYFPMCRVIGKKECAQLLGCSIRQVDYLRENYGLPWVRFGKMVKFLREDVEQWIEAQKQTGPGCVPSLSKKSN